MSGTGKLRPGWNDYLNDLKEAEDKTSNEKASSAKKAHR
jgi:hypothetical protein